MNMTNETLYEARRCIAAMIERSEKAWAKLAPGTAQHTLLKNRINALYTAAWAVTRQLMAERAPFSENKLAEDARAPIASLVSKSEKVLLRVAEDSWQHRMLEENVKALTIAQALLFSEDQAHNE